VPTRSRPLDPRQITLLEHGRLLFDQRQYFAAHEVWEECWIGWLDADREVLQGLIQAAVALHHREQRNAAGAATVAARALAKLQPAATPWHGIDLTEVIAQLEPLVV
jgi:predicted metal-dependent hydrolase